MSNRTRWTLDDLNKLDAKQVKIDKPTRQTIISKISEDDLQRICISWFKWVYPEYALRVFHPANGGFRNVIEATKLKKMGVLPGVCDIIITIPKGRYHGMFAELKVGDNTLSENQEAFIMAHEKDYYCVVCWTEQEFKDEVRKYLNL